MEQKRWLRGYLAGLAAEAGVEAPESLAERLLILHEGANVGSSPGIPANAVQEARQVAAVLVTSLPDIG